LQKKETSIKQSKLNYKIIIIIARLKKRFEKVLFEALNYLYFNKIPIHEFLVDNPFPAKPFSLKCKYKLYIISIYRFA
jgi:hypothetical protein